MEKLLISLTSLNETNGQIMSHRVFKGNLNTANKNLTGILKSEVIFNQDDFIPENAFILDGKYNNKIIMTFMALKY